MIDAADVVVARSGWTGHEEFAIWAERQVIGGNGRLNRCEYEDLAVGINFENCAAAIADKKIALRVKCETCGDAHAFDPLLRAAVGRNAVNGAVMAAGDV